jgi:hypothetical protein
MINKEVYKIIDFIVSKDGIGNKSVLIEEVQKLFGLTKDRSVYYSENVAIRFSSSNSLSFGNTVLSLSNLQKYDELPFIVCLVTPNKNFVYLANTTFLQKVSHSSQLLRVDNIRGSFNGSDIVKDFNGLTNLPDNFQKLFSIHEEIGFKYESNKCISRVSTEEQKEAGNSLPAQIERIDSYCKRNRSILSSHSALMKVHTRINEMSSTSCLSMFKR